MKVSKCGEQRVADVIVKDTEGKDYRVTMFHEVVEQIKDLGKWS